MATPTVKLVPIELDQPRLLRLDFNALIAAEDVTGRDYARRETWLSLRFGDMRAIVWACLRHEDEKLTVEDVGRMLHPGNVEYVADCLAQVRDENWPEADDVTEEDAAADPLPPSSAPVTPTSPPAGPSPGTISG